MAETFGSRLKKAWNIFFNRAPTNDFAGPSYSYRPDRPIPTRSNERTIFNSATNRMALDVASITIQHVKVDDEGRYSETIKSELNGCLTLEANKDQTAAAFFKDAVLSMFDEGVVAIVPVDFEDSETRKGEYDITSMRVGKITEWMPDHVRVHVYNDRTGQKEDIIMEKRTVAIVENPFYSVMNERNSTLQRLIRKLSLLDAVDEQSSSGKLDLLIQLPYTIKSETRREMAEKRRKDIEMQLTGSKYGIAYVDATEHVTQLNRPIENNLMKQVEYLTNTFYGQLCITPGILDGTADEETMLNYMNRTVKVIIKAIVDELKRKFLSKKARMEGEDIMYFIDPFERMSVTSLADAADKFTRNEIMSTNEVRCKIGMKPSKDPKAEELLNKNISQPTERLADSTKNTENSQDNPEQLAEQE